MNPSQASLERAHALRQRARARGVQRPLEREQSPFPIVLRGYDRAAVDEYVGGLNHMIAELQMARSPQAAVREALDRVGEETSTILQRAHETAEQITSGARADAQRCLEEARRDADSLRSQAAQQARTLASDSDSVWDERGALLEDMRRLAESILEVADTAGDRITKSPADAVRAAIEAAQAESEGAEAHTSIDGDPVDAGAPHDSLPSVRLSGPESVPDDEPRVWREPQPTEQFDALEEDDEPYVDGHHDDGQRASGPYGAGGLHGPYYS